MAEKLLSQVRPKKLPNIRKKVIRRNTLGRFLGVSFLDFLKFGNKKRKDVSLDQVHAHIVRNNLFSSGLQMPTKRQFYRAAVPVLFPLPAFYFGQ